MKTALTILAGFISGVLVAIGILAAFVFVGPDPVSSRPTPSPSASPVVSASPSIAPSAVPSAPQLPSGSPTPAPSGSPARSASPSPSGSPVSSAATAFQSRELAAVHVLELPVSR